MEFDKPTICLALSAVLLVVSVVCYNTSGKKEGFMQPGIDNTASRSATNPLYYG